MARPPVVAVSGNLADETRLADQPITTYTKALREDLIRMMQERAKQTLRDVDARGESDAYLQTLRGITKRIDDVESIARGFAVQTHEGCAPFPEAAEAALDELRVALEALFGLELEGRALQRRMTNSAEVLEYAGARSYRPQQISFTVDQFLLERFRRLQARVKDERARSLGRTEGLDLAGLLNLLISMGEANVPTLVMLGCPDMAAAMSVTALAEGRAVNGRHG